ncbi:expressed unknown protein [Seminavis robusta]|uniref:Uncharacterized protein n=1 Tax=Seminavis robusta TaxID=568900 RepID=A0A9N8EL78_9STRA|nr:expressed unknown protein [Seminavis robusta]|eukprot:Sro1398_g269290.1 n/a (341) ;mRNA; f:22701-23723
MSLLGYISRFSTAIAVGSISFAGLVLCAWSSAFASFFIQASMADGQDDRGARIFGCLFAGTSILAVSLIRLLMLLVKDHIHRHCDGEEGEQTEHMGKATTAIGFFIGFGLPWVALETVLNGFVSTYKLVFAATMCILWLFASDTTDKVRAKHGDNNKRRSCVGIFFLWVLEFTLHVLFTSSVTIWLMEYAFGKVLEGQSNLCVFMYAWTVSSVVAISTYRMQANLSSRFRCCLRMSYLQWNTKDKRQRKAYFAENLFALVAVVTLSSIWMRVQVFHMTIDPTMAHSAIAFLNIGSLLLLAHNFVVFLEPEEGSPEDGKDDSKGKQFDWQDELSVPLVRVV